MCAAVFEKQVASISRRNLISLGQAPIVFNLPLVPHPALQSLTPKKYEGCTTFDWHKPLGGSFDEVARTTSLGSRFKARMWPVDRPIDRGCVLGQREWCVDMTMQVPFMGTKDLGFPHLSK